MAKDDDLLGNAIIATEKEIAASAWDADPEALDPSGDRSLEEMGDGLEGQHEEPEEEGEGLETDGKVADKEVAEAKEKAGETEPKTGEVIPPEPQGRVPAGRLREESEARRKAEAERDELKAKFEAATANEKTSLDTLRAEFDRKLAEQIAALKAPTPPAEKPKVPDLFEDPNAFAEHLTKSVGEQFTAFQRAQRDREVNQSIDSARERHGDTFKGAWDALSALPKDGNTAQLVKQLESARNPGEAIVSWHKRNVAAREVGDDLDGFKARIEKETREKLAADPEFHKQLLASLRGDAEVGDRGVPRTAVRLPPALSRQAGGNGRGVNDDNVIDGSEQAIADSAWG